ncbi:flagellar basal body P-ring protein FlgI [Borrelia miyamotoi]|uniref:Flagellar basal body P-ring protein FlgI n=1 Tax=Borrelia miyamotoi TaxID=47466 RepID=A0AAQ2WVY0_9SPIR|nr:flagellar basal body P-ring protein FlgI [Borrelia miyamotoi]AGT27715.1 flagellar basal body P-ring protein [Borrelia miyamotoi LB-2001]AJA58868.1 flagellar basal body P-ring biosynthesis protein FlgA [Borrelia miyamotoi]AOW95958.1 flagellar biosynthesis protein FlgA [Borrelia miyamotoi]QTL83850.1 flagellar basal body P-ring protein FlgI [Borrelia miyamotoi]WAZ84844.1 flagellar basal body P-ring protein FlgI [Borrelia miyamotoi]
MKTLIIIAILSLKTVISSFTQENQTPKNFIKDNNIINQISDQIKIKDLAEIQSNDSYTLTGIGIVAGLTDKGDSSKGKEILNQALKEIGINEIDLTKIESKNIALVSATIKINGNMIKGTNHNVYIASILDSKDLTNGILLRTELRNKEGKVIATASGPISTNSKSKGTGYILNGATIHENKDYTNYNIILKKEDHTLADSISKKLTSKKIKNSIKSGKIIEIEIKKNELLSEIEKIEIATMPKVLISEKNKLIIASKNAEIGPLILAFERYEKNSFSNKKNEKVKIEIQKMKISEFILKNSDSLSNEELIKIIKASKKINKLNGELILEE